MNYTNILTSQAPRLIISGSSMLKSIMLEGVAAMLPEESIKSTCELKIFFISNGSTKTSPFLFVVLVLIMGLPNSWTIFKVTE
jgi:hypothetical protein